MNAASYIELKPNKNIPDFRVGDTVRVHAIVVEGERRRTQAFEGVVIRRKRGGVNSSFTVRRVSHGIGVERVFPYYSPLVDRVEVTRVGRVRQARLYYLRDRIGKAARIKAGSRARFEELTAGRPVEEEEVVEEAEIEEGAEVLDEEAVTGEAEETQDEGETEAADEAEAPAEEADAPAEEEAASEAAATTKEEPAAEAEATAEEEAAPEAEATADEESPVADTAEDPAPEAEAPAEEVQAEEEAEASEETPADEGGDEAADESTDGEEDK